jgi:hypothetical protein
MTGIRWNPIVNVLKPTEAMTGEHVSEEISHAEPSKSDKSESGWISKLSGRFKRKERVD